jgi:4-amino-4-deoxy-L-arabinose transferase-like glycosyltransferase
VVLLGLLCGFTFFAGLGRPAISDSDEAFYAEAGREMVESGDWLTPHYNYEHRLQKPILFYWLVSAGYVSAGVREAAARFPAALAGLGLVLVTYFCTRRWYDPATAVLAGAIVATSFGYFAIARLALPDLPLAFFITLAIWACIESYRTSSLADPGARGLQALLGARRRWLIVGAFALAMGFLTKGPVALVLPALVVLPVLGWQRWGADASPPPRFGFGDLALAGGVFALLAVPWYLAMTRVHGLEYLHGFFIGENVERFATDRFNRPRPIWFYLPIVLGGMLPWSPLLLLWLKPSWEWMRRERGISQVAGRLVLWAALPLVFFSLSIGKQPRYILPILPPLAILLARAIHERLAPRTALPSSGRDGLLVASGGIAGGLLVCLGLLLYRARPLLVPMDATWPLLSAAMIAMAGLVVIAAALAGRARQLPLVLALAGALTLVALHYSVRSVAGPEPVERIAAALLEHRLPGEPSGTYGVFVRNLVYYTGIRQVDLGDEPELVRYLSSPGRVFCVMARRDLERLERLHGLRLQGLAEVLYFNPADMKLRTLLWPDPARDLEAVLLVSNR